MNHKYMDIKEFRDKGYLQELNRQFLHPLGLALRSIQDGDNEKLDIIFDARDNKEGLHFDLKNANIKRKTHFAKNKEFIQSRRDARNKDRIDSLGFWIEPIEGEK